LRCGSAAAARRRFSYSIEAAPPDHERLAGTSMVRFLA
jgi:hypothetical protein